MARRTCASFLEQFTLPLVAGGRMHIGKPIGLDELQTFEEQLPHATEPLVAVDEARTEVLSELVVRPPALVLDADELQLSAAVYNLLFLCHPRTDSWLVTSGGVKKVADTAQRFAAQPISQNRTRVLARHALLHNLFDIQRTDTVVSWWTGSATYEGQPAPSRLRAWRSIRRVREETSLAEYDELLAGPDAAPVMATLLRRSPLTQLLDSHKAAPPLHWEDAVFLLRDAELARAIAYNALSADEPGEMVITPARFAAAFERMLERSPKVEDLRAVAAFLSHLNVLIALAETRERDLSVRSPLLTTVLAPERAGQRPRGLATFFALPNALRKVDIRLSEPPGLRDDPALTLRWERHREHVEEGVGESVIETLAGRIRRHFERGEVRTGA